MDEIKKYEKQRDEQMKAIEDDFNIKIDRLKAQKKKAVKKAKKMETGENLTVVDVEVSDDKNKK